MDNSMNLIDVNNAFALSNVIFVDVRSESEYALDHLPNAINIPVFTDEERANVGTAYHKISREKAGKMGLEIVAPKLPRLVEEIQTLAKQGNVVLYCWRGGMRSTSLSVVLDLMRVPHYKLERGYKAFRSMVNDYFSGVFPFSVEVLHGLTGVGKTHIIKSMISEGVQAIDLEGLAGNRGSAFGNVGLPPQPTQKKFETDLWYQLYHFDQAKPIIVECESKRIGRLLLPDSLHEAMKNGGHLLAYDTVENRVKRIIDDYEPEHCMEEIEDAVIRLKQRLGSDNMQRFLDMLSCGNFNQVTEELLHSYYDPLYSYPDSPSEEYDFSVDAANSGKAGRDVSVYLQGKYKV